VWPAALPAFGRFQPKDSTSGRRLLRLQDFSPGYVGSGSMAAESVGAGNRPIDRSAPEADVIRSSIDRVDFGWRRSQIGTTVATLDHHLALYGALLLSVTASARRSAA